MKKILQKCFLYFGFVLRRANLYSCDNRRLLRFFEHHKIDIVLDVGANSGQFAQELLESGFKGKIVSFEALPHVYEDLKQNAKTYGKQWVVAPQCAISDEEKTVNFHVTKENTSSSMLKPSENANDLPDFFDVNDVIKVKSKRLDTLLKEMDITSNHIYLKIDVQGAEKKVLRGADKIMEQIQGMTVEMPLYRYYEKQPLARELDKWIIQRNFELWDIVPVLRQPETGRLDYFDAIYFKK